MAYRILAFDSGIGGLGVVQSLRQQLSRNGIEAIIDYLADNAVFPYGEQPDDRLIQRIVTIIGQAIHKLQPDLIVIACNTASTIALDTLRKTYPFIPFVGCVPPIRWAARLSKTRYIGLLATRATIRRPYLQDLQKQYAADCKLIAYGSPNLARIAEQFYRGETTDLKAIAIELAALFHIPESEHIDTICLGCTHYTFIMDALKNLSSSNIQWLDPAPAVAKHAIDLLQQDIIPQRAIEGHGNRNRFFFTAPPIEDNNLLKQINKLDYDRILNFETDSSKILA